VTRSGARSMASPFGPFLEGRAFCDQKGLVLWNLSIYHPIIIDLAALYAFKSPLLTLALDLKAGWLSVVSISTNSE